ncbi:thiol:disulfide interchange protein DsbC [Desulfacinum hydrothermale DSM 13146]|uniref:Thiol:disulfide interchange protein DsbC n=1 Tax=Desulfacinum hydrothermale DSM 13146 TaxID=1121390 RepID=A0A1W1X7I3_9BACT|nr:DsbC family protein [Desulfacinum hydrothermale]SMC19481.1 thiol:disulfide interchange protein DsbC [Desulfacinum hydrothermale DSM 13146]
MSIRKHTFALAIAAALLLTLIAIPQAHCEDLPETCPKVSTVQEILTKTFSRSMTVKAVLPMKTLQLCEAHVVFNGRNQIVYMDKTGRHLILGQIVDTATRRNLTRESLNQLNRFSKEDMKELDSLVAFSVGPEDAKHSVFMVTDPQCPFCKKAEGAVEELAKEGLVRTRFLLFPLPNHKGAKETCISILCDQKGFQEFKNGYQSDNQCKEGREQIERSLRSLKSHGISGTPTYIFPDGSFHAGVLSRKALLKRLEKE